MAGGARTTVLVATLLVVAACTRATGNDTANDDAGSTTAAAPVGTEPTASAPASSAAPVTSPPATTSPATSAPPSAVTSAPPPPTPSTTSAPAPNPLPAPAAAPTSAFAIVESDLVEIDPADGAIRRTIVEFFEGDGVFRGDLELTPDRSAAYFGESYEDGWFGCESSVGEVGRVDLASGAISRIGPGWSPSLSPSGDRLAFLTSSVCVPDPEAPDIWVLTPADRVVVLDLASADRVEIVSATSPVGYTDPNALDWVAFHPSGDLLVGIAAGDVHRIDSATAGVVQDGPVVLSDGVGHPVAVYDDAVVTLSIGDEGASTVAAVDLASGAAAPLWESEIPVAVAGEDGANVLVVDATAPSTTQSGNVTVLALDAFVVDVAW